MGMDAIADQPQHRFEISRGCLEGFGIDGERCAENHERRSIFRGADGLFDGEAPHSLDRNANRVDDFAQLIERAWYRFACCRQAPALIVPDVMNDEVATEILEPPGGCEFVFGSQVVAHDLYAEIPSRLHNHFHGLGVGALHHHDVRGSGLGHQLRFQPSAVHRFEVRHNGNAGKFGPQGANPIHAFSDDERGPGFEPVYVAANGAIGRIDGFRDGCKVERNLDDGIHCGSSGSGKWRSIFERRKLADWRNSSIPLTPSSMEIHEWKPTERSTAKMAS